MHFFALKLTDGDFSLSLWQFCRSLVASRRFWLGRTGAFGALKAYLNPKTSPTARILDKTDRAVLFFSPRQLQLDCCFPPKPDASVRTAQTMAADPEAGRAVSKSPAE